MVGRDTSLPPNAHIRTTFAKNDPNRSRFRVGFGVLLVALAVVVPATAAQAPQPVLNPVAEGYEGPPLQSPERVAARIGKLATSPALGKLGGVIVVDPATGETLYDDDANAAMVPASTMKIVTAATVLSTMGADATVSTRVTRSPDSGEVFLVGGGDPLLESNQFKKDPSEPKYPKATSMKRLAKETANELRREGITTLDLRYDDSLFTGPAYHPDWYDRFRGQMVVGNISALTVDDGRLGRWGPRSDDPAKSAGERFAQLLADDGLTVSGVAPGVNPEDAVGVAQIESAPMYVLVGQMLARSDNDTAETLFRLAGHRAGYGGSFEGGQRATQQVMSDLGVSTVMANISDGSGLSDKNQISPRLLADILQRVVAREGELWPIASGMPVAAVNGTLRNRFQAVNTSAGAGRVRAKTGTLISTSSLAGLVHTKSSRVLVFAAIANEATASYDASVKIDEIAANLAKCGCDAQ